MEMSIIIIVSTNIYITKINYIISVTANDIRSNMLKDSVVLNDNKAQ